MTTQIVIGWPSMYRNIRRFFRVEDNPGLVDDVTIADSLSEAESALSDLVLESGVGWLVKTLLVNDVGLNLGKAFGRNGRFLFLIQDLALTDPVRIKMLYREHPNTSDLIPIAYVGTDSDAADVSDPAWYSGRKGGEMWIESGDLNTAGNHELGIRILNWNTTVTNAQLRVDYWFTPPVVDVAWFTETDASGDLKRSPSLPRQMWPFILNNAKLIIAEQTGDLGKIKVLNSRILSPAGVLNRIREQLSNFQSEGSEVVTDVFRR